jgi:hypothetical protein
MPKKENVLFDLPHLLPKSIFRSSCAKPIFEVPQLSNSVIFLSLGCWRVVFAWRYRNWVYKVPQLANMFILSLNYQIYFFLDTFESDIRMTWRWVNMPGTCGCGTHVTWLSSSPFLILPSLSLTLLSLCLLILIQNDRALGSSIPTAASSCGGERREKLRRAPAMEHAERYDTKGSCGRARGERKEEDTKHVGSTITCA